MGSIIEIDSIRRDREAYPSPADFTVPTDQINGWFRSARSVRSFPQNPALRPHEFVTAIELKALTIPWEAAFTTLQRVYVNFESQRHSDVHLVSSIQGILRDAKFVLVLDRIQTDSVGNPVWIHFRSLHPQVMRFKRDDPIRFRVFDRNGTTLPITDNPLPDDPDPTKQVIASFDAVPYIRDDDFSNHNTDPVS